MGVSFRLSIMMFLQYAIWGAWLPILWPFLAGHRGFDADEIGTMFAVGAIGALIAPFVAGQIADRAFATQKFLGISHLLGAGLIWFLAEIESFWGFLAFSLIYSIIYSPTLPLTNSITLHHVTDRDRDFGRIRVWGTVGWIVVGLGMGQWLAQKWTPDATEATAATIEASLFDATERRAILEESVVTLKDKTTVTGVVTSRTGDEISIDVSLAVPDDLKEVKGLLEFAAGITRPARDAEPPEGGWPEGTRWIESRTLDAAEVDSIRRRIESLTKDAAAATAVRTAAESLNAADDESIRERLLASLTEEAPFTDDALLPAIQARQNAGRADAFRLSAILGALLGIFCFFLPHTPPRRQAAEPLAFSAAFQRIRLNPLITLFLLAIPVSCIHQFFFVHTSGFLSASGVEVTNDWILRIFGVGGGGLMTIGQVTELLVLALIPVFAKSFSRKTFLAIGLVAYGLRMALFAYHDAIPLPTAVTLLLGVSLHGFCFGCFIFISFMIVDEETSSDVRATAQSLYNLIIIGCGIIVGSKIAGWVQAWATTDDVLDYTRLFSVPMWGSVGCLILLLVLYPNRRRVEPAAAA